MEKKKEEVAGYKTSLQPIADNLTKTEKLLNEKLVLLPNLPSKSAPAGKTPADNVVVRGRDQTRITCRCSFPHWLIKKYDIVDF